MGLVQITHTFNQKTKSRPNYGTNVCKRLKVVCYYKFRFFLKISLNGPKPDINQTLVVRHVLICLMVTTCISASVTIDPSSPAEVLTVQPITNAPIDPNGTGKV